MKFLKITRQRGSLLRKETEGGEGIFKYEGLKILGDLAVGASEDEAKLFTCNWVSK